MNHPPIRFDRYGLQWFHAVSRWIWVSFILLSSVAPIDLTPLIPASIVGATFLQPHVYAQSQAPKLWPKNLDTSHPPLFYCRIVRSYPHDPEAFTQGLIFSDGFFFEGTGLNGRSSLRKVEPITGRVVKIKSLPNRYFGEGIARFKDRLIQLTWKAGTVFSYDIYSFQVLDTLSWPREGWGITTDHTHLIISDGTHKLYFLDPDTFTVSRTLPVMSDNGPVSRLNELEWVEGVILANVWQTDKIAVIEPQTGRVAAWISMAGLAAAPRRGVPNGIAYDYQSRRLYVTGKRWPQIFEVTLSAKQ